MSDNVQIGARISPQLHEKLVAYARQTNRSKSKAIARAIATYLGCPEEMEIDDRVSWMEERLASLETREAEQLTIGELVTDGDQSSGTIQSQESQIDPRQYQQTHQQLEAALAEQIWQLKQLQEQLAQTTARLERIDPQNGHPQLLPQSQYQLQQDPDKYSTFRGSAVNGVQQIIRDMLLYLNLKVPRSKFEATDCNRVLRDVLAVCDGAIKQSNARLTFDYLPMAIADEIRLLELFEQLIANAIKFRRPDVPLKIHISATPQNGEWRFVVHDNGIGIPRKHLRSIGMFKRLHSSGHYPGTGMGLALCKQIVEIHGGRIWAESQLGVSTSIYFTIPWQPGGSTQNKGRRSNW